MNDQRKYQHDPKIPPKSNAKLNFKHVPQQQTPNMPTDDVENTTGTNQEGDLLFANKPMAIPRRTGRMTHGNRWSRSATINHQHILKENKKRRKNIAMPWIDRKTPYYMVQQSWVSGCVKMYQISDEVIKFLKNTMKKLKSAAASRRKKNLGEVKTLTEIL